MRGYRVGRAAAVKRRQAVMPAKREAHSKIVRAIVAKPQPQEVA